MQSLRFTDRFLPCSPFFRLILNATKYRLESQLLDDLQKNLRAKKCGRAELPTARRAIVKHTLCISEIPTVEVYEKLGEGGFGAVFAAKTVQAKAKVDAEQMAIMTRTKMKITKTKTKNLIEVAIKVVKPSNVWEFRMLRKVHAELPARLRASIIHPQALYAFQDEELPHPQPRHAGLLLDIINRSGQAGISQQGACLDELLVIFFTVELLRLLEGLHESAALIHGDLKIDNCLVRLQDVPGGSSAWAAQYEPNRRRRLGAARASCSSTLAARSTRARSPRGQGVRR